VHAYAAAGVSVFLIDVPRGSPTPVQRAIAEQVIPELREWHAANPASRT
jgi:hypothetical protein